MFNIGGWEFLFILVVALLFLGPERLPGAAKQAGKTLGTLREMAQSFQTELEQAVNDPIEAGARLAGDKAVKDSQSTKGDTVAVDGTTSPSTTSPSTTSPSTTSPSGQAAATAAHVAATEPDRTEKPITGSMAPAGEQPADAGEQPADAGEQPADAGEQPADQVPDPANLEFGSAAPRYPAPDNLDDPVDHIAPGSSDADSAPADMAETASEELVDEATSSASDAAEVVTGD